ncbi:MAG: Stf0 family sulfotransferase [Pseudomonadota bacterium]
MHAIQESNFGFPKSLTGLVNPFKDVQDSPHFRAKLEARELPANRYVIFFTPRSGSSRLTDIVAAADGLGKPGECFNLKHIREMIEFFGAQSMQDYVNLLMRYRNDAGTFGSEIAMGQMHTFFASPDAFFDIYQPTACLFLIRENIIQQAVSMSRKKQTGVAHNTPRSVTDARSGEFKYDAGEIAKALKRLAKQEVLIEELCSQRGIEPLRLSYESLLDKTATQFLPVIAEFVGADLTNVEGARSDHQKLGDEKNLAFAKRFADERSRLVESIEERRASTLATLRLQNARHFPSASTLSE